MRIVFAILVGGVVFFYTIPLALISVIANLVGLLTCSGTRRVDPFSFRAGHSLGVHQVPPDLGSEEQVVVFSSLRSVGLLFLLRVLYINADERVR